MNYNDMLATSDESGTIQKEMALVEAAKANPVAFEPLYQRYKLRVYRYFFIRSGREEESADLMQQVFLQALQALPNYQAQGAPFAAWLFRIAHHLASNAYHRKKESVSWDFVSDNEQLNSEGDPETVFLKQERLTQLKHLLIELDPMKRELLALRFSAGLSSAEIALVVGKSQAAVKKQLIRTLQKLKEQMI